MSSITLQQPKNMFLIFPPGCGGNHLANLLSMHPHFAPRYTYAEYYRNMQDKYKTYFDIFDSLTKTEVAHYCDLQNLQPKVLKTLTSKILSQDKPYIFCSHASEYILCEKPLLTPFTDKIFCLFSYPTGVNELVYNRMTTGIWAKGESSISYDKIKINLLYRKEIFAKKNKIDPNNIFTLDTDIFYTIKGYDYLHDIIKTNLGIELPNICRKMHTQYIKHAYLYYGNS